MDFETDRECGCMEAAKALVGSGLALKAGFPGHFEKSNLPSLLPIPEDHARPCP